MSNQRPGKVVRAADPTMKDMNTLKFFKNLKSVTLKKDQLPFLKDRNFNIKRE